MEEERTLFLAAKGGSGTLKFPFEDFEKRWLVVGEESSSDEVSKARSSSRKGLFRFSFSVNSGSMVDSVRSCQPF